VHRATRDRERGRKRLGRKRTRAPARDQNSLSCRERLFLASLSSRESLREKDSFAKTLILETEREGASERKRREGEGEESALSRDSRECRMRCDMCKGRPLPQYLYVSVSLTTSTYLPFISLSVHYSFSFMILSFHMSLLP